MARTKAGLSLLLAGLVLGALVVVPRLHSSSTAVQVVVAPVRMADIDATVAGSGIVQAAVDDPVVPGDRGTITKVWVTAGEHVTSGQRLVTLFTGAGTTEAARARAALRAAQADLRLNPDDETLRAKVAAAQQDLADAATPTKDLKATMDGEVTSLVAQVGTDVPRDVVLLRVVDRDSAIVQATASGDQADMLRPDLPATIATGITSQAILAGSVTSVDPALTPGGKVAFTVTVKDPGHTLSLAAIATVRVTTTRTGVVAAPRLGVLDALGQPYAFVASGGRVQQRELQVGVTDADLVQVLVGLRPGDEVVIAGAQTLTDGDPVRTRSP